MPLSTYQMAFLFLLQRKGKREANESVAGFLAF